MMTMGSYWMNFSGKQSIKTLLGIGSKKALSGIHFFQGEIVPP
jgi:hypothetical protein